MNSVSRRRKTTERQRDRRRFRGKQTVCGYKCDHRGKTLLQMISHHQR